MVFDNNFKCTGTSNYYRVKITLSYNSVNVSTVGSVITFKERFRIHKSYISTSRKRCGVAKQFLENCTSECNFDNLQIQLTESVTVPDNLLGQKYCQAKLFTLSHALNSLSDWYYINRKGCRK